MSANIVDALSRHAAQSVTRRGSLLTLGSTLAAAVAAPSLAQAGKNTGQKRKNARKKAERRAAEQAEQTARDAAEQAQQAENQANQICANQIAGCRAAVLSACSLPGGKCIAAADCCSSLGVCNTTEFFTCIVAVA